MKGLFLLRQTWLPCLNGNGRQIARQRMDKQPLDFTFNSSILNDAENNENLNLKDGKIKDELQVMAIQQARFKAGFCRN